MLLEKLMIISGQFYSFYLTSHLLQNGFALAGSNYDSKQLFMKVIS